MKLKNNSWLAFAVVSVASATAQPFLTGYAGREEENNSNNDGLIPTFGYRSPFQSSLQENRLQIPYSKSLSTFFDEAALAQKRFFSSFFDGEATFSRMGDTSPHSFLRRGMNSFLPEITMPHLRDSEVIDNHEKFQVSLQLPDGIESKDVHIQVKDGGTRLLIQSEASAVNDDIQKNADGDRNAQRYTSSTAIKFSQSYSLDPTVVKVEEFDATVEKGRLTVWAPKDEQKARSRDHDVRIHDLSERSELEKSNRFDPSNPHVLRVPLTKTEKLEEEEKIAAAKARANMWKDVSQTTL